nr:MAG TPA: hypothetical protein [Caudoviricetes sp.]
MIHEMDYSPAKGMPLALLDAIEDLLLKGDKSVVDYVDRLYEDKTKNWRSVSVPEVLKPYLDE